tara:strand:- start:918 stop:1124 length:207 start_codon:yes stop_codon:yes gene_type:complete
MSEEKSKNTGSVTFTLKGKSPLVVNQHAYTGGDTWIVKMMNANTPTALLENIKVDTTWNEKKGSAKHE